jgi:hypothetical protein
MVALIMLFAMQRPEALIFGVFLCAVYVLVNYWPIQYTNKDLANFIIISTLFLPAFAKSYHGLSPIFYYISSISVFFAAKHVSRNNPEILLSALRTTYAVAIAAISTILYVYWGYPEPFGMVIEGSSNNGIPSYLIIIQIALSLANFLVYRRLPLISAITTGAVAFVGNGRGSLVVAALIIISSLIFNFMIISRGSRVKRAIYILSIIVVFIYLTSDAEELWDSLFVYTKLSVGLEDENRIEIIDDYMAKIDVYSLFFGADYSGTVIESSLNGNPHIAYIRTHSFYGLPLTLIAMFSPAIVFFSRKKIVEKIVFFSFVSMATLRATSEPVLFPTLLDFFYFLNFFMFFRYGAEVKFGRKF